MSHSAHAEAAQVTADIITRAGNGGGESAEPEPEETGSQAESISNGERPELESSRVDVPDGQSRSAAFTHAFGSAHPAGSTTPNAGFTGRARPLAKLPGDDND